MLGNIKEFISVVQDGLTSNTNIRHTLNEVQKVKKFFQDKQKAAIETKVNYGAGGDLLEKYQEHWAEIHNNAEKNAKSVDEVDKLVSELHESTKSRLKSANEVAQNLAYLPSLTASVAQCVDSLKNIQILLNTVEQELVEFEDVIEKYKMERWKLDHHYQFSLYKEKKMASLEEIRSKLAKENLEKGQEREKQMLAELQAKRESSAAAFQKDIAVYLTSGSVPIKPSPPSNVELEQVDLDIDNTDLENFLES